MRWSDLQSRGLGSSVGHSPDVTWDTSFQCCPLVLAWESQGSFQFITCHNSAGVISEKEAYILLRLIIQLFSKREKWQFSIVSLNARSFETLSLNFYLFINIAEIIQDIKWLFPLIICSIHPPVPLCVCARACTSIGTHMHTYTLFTLMECF